MTGFWEKILMKKDTDFFRGSDDRYWCLVLYDAMLTGILLKTAMTLKMEAEISSETLAALLINLELYPRVPEFIC